MRACADRFIHLIRLALLKVLIMLNNSDGYGNCYHISYIIIATTSKQMANFGGCTIFMQRQVLAIITY